MKRAFTLIELLAAITILAILTLVVVPAVSRQMRNSTGSLSEMQINNIKNAAKAWGADNVFKLPSEGKCVTVTLGYLKDLGYLDISVKNPEDKKEYNDSDTFVNISKEGNNYLYEVKNSNSGDKCELVDEAIKGE